MRASGRRAPGETAAAQARRALLSRGPSEPNPPGVKRLPQGAGDTAAQAPPCAQAGDGASSQRTGKKRLVGRLRQGQRRPGAAQRQGGMGRAGMERHLQ